MTMAIDAAMATATGAEKAPPFLDPDDLAAHAIISLDRAGRRAVQERERRRWHAAPATEEVPLKVIVAAYLLEHKSGFNPLTGRAMEGDGDEG